MKNPVHSLPDAKAQSQISKYLLVGYTCALLAFFIFGWLAVIAFALGVRAWLLCGHRANQKHPKIKQLRGASGLLVVGAALEWLLYMLAV